MVQAREYINDFPFPLKTITTKRVGLAIKESDEKEFHNEPLRYVIVLPKSQGFKQKINGIESLVNDLFSRKEISPDEAKEILGYNRKIR